MRIALVTTPASVPSGIGDYTRHLLPYLREHCSVRVFVDGECGEGEEPVASLETREHERILYQLGNEHRHAFMPRMIRSLGGTVMLHDWILFDMAMKAFPALERGGLAGHAFALREGGVEQTRIYARNWLERRRQRLEPEPELAPERLAALRGVFAYGWHAAEDAGRWTSDRAYVRVPARGVRQIAVCVEAAPGRTVELHHGTRTLAAHACSAAAPWARLLAEIEPADEPVVCVTTFPVTVTKEQRQNGDTRRLGAFVQSIEWSDGRGAHRLDMSIREDLPIVPLTLARDRFRLPLNRSVVRFADGFIVHSHYVKERILRERNAVTPVGVLHHGAEIRWRDEERSAVRRRIGLGAEWIDCFLLVSFGGVQPHKRIEKVFAGVARARAERRDVRLAMVGGWTGEGLSPRDLARRHGIEDAVHVTGYVPEREAWDWIHAGDASINLRGPTTGGTSGGIFQSLSLGRTVIATDAAEQAELPDSCVLKVPLEDGEVEAIARILVELCDHPERRDRLERAARDFVERECHWGVVAKEYAGYLEDMPPPRAMKRPSIAVRVWRELEKRKQAMPSPRTRQ